MKRKLLFSVLGSLAILVAGISVAYAFGTFKANQEGFRQAGEGQAARLAIRVEAGMADANSDLVPDDFYLASTSPGGALTFSITNTSDLPMQVSKIELASRPCGISTCPLVSSNKNGDGTFNPGAGDCKTFVAFVSPSNFDNWPTIAAHSTLQVNGTDNNRLGAGMIHLANNTPQGCQGALFALVLNVTASEATQPFGNVLQP